MVRPITYIFCITPHDKNYDKSGPVNNVQIKFKTI